jgi:hypothetical protein
VVIDSLGAAQIVNADAGAAVVLKIGGNVATPLEISAADRKKCPERP